MAILVGIFVEFRGFLLLLLLLLLVLDLVLFFFLLLLFFFFFSVSGKVFPIPLLVSSVFVPRVFCAYV